MNTFRINITKEIYKQTMYCGYYVTNKENDTIATNCAVAKAISVLFPNAWVMPRTILFYADIEKREFPIGVVDLPEEATDMIYAFDNCLPENRLNLSELSFNIEIEDELLEKLVDITEINTILKDCKSLELV